MYELIMWVINTLCLAMEQLLGSNETVPQRLATTGTQIAIKAAVLSSWRLEFGQSMHPFGRVGAFSSLPSLVAWHVILVNSLPHDLDDCANGQFDFLQHRHERPDVLIHVVGSQQQGAW